MVVRTVSVGWHALSHLTNTLFTARQISAAENEILNAYPRIVFSARVTNLHLRDRLTRSTSAEQSHMLTVQLSISLDNDQLDAHLLYFTIRPLQSPTCLEHYMLIIRRLNCIDAASGIVTLSKWPSGVQVEREL